MRCLVALTAIFVIATIANLAQAGESNVNFRACRSDADCVPVLYQACCAGVLNSRISAINKNYVTEYKKSPDWNGSSQKCRKPGPLEGAPACIMDLSADERSLAFYKGVCNKTNKTCEPAEKK